MSIEQSDAIVLRVFPWSETSCVANIYTRDFGKLSVLAKGARRPKSPFEAALDLLSICRVVFIAKSADALDILTEAKLQRRFRAGTRDLLRLYCGYYVAELLDRLTDKGDKQPEIFDLAKTTLDDLERMESEPRAVMLRFELQMLRMVGHLPSWQLCAQCGRDIHRPLREHDSALDTDAALPSDRSEERNWTIFSSFSSGVLCQPCQPGARQMIRLPETARQELIRFSDDNWRTINTDSYPEHDRSTLRTLTTRYLTVLLDRQLQLHAYLEELGR